MIESDVFVQALENLGVNFFTGVPDSLLGGIIEELLTRKLYTCLLYTSPSPRD